MLTDFTKNVVFIIQNIPAGKVLSYGAVAALAGNPRAARQVSRILHSMTQKYHLPWQRVVNRLGKISLNDPVEYEEQKFILISEGVRFDQQDQIEKQFFWSIQNRDQIKGDPIE